MKITRYCLFAVVTAICCACNGPYRKQSVAMDVESIELLKAKLVEWLTNSPQQKLRPLAKEAAEAQVEVDGKYAHIGPWVYSPADLTLTKYKAPENKMGFDLVFHVRRTDRGW